MSEPCGAELASCKCTNPKDECEGVHSCTGNGCMGSWKDDGTIVTFPFGGSNPTDALISMLYSPRLFGGF